MAPHGLTFGEHCVDLEKNCKDVEPLEKQIYSENQHNVHEKYGLESTTLNEPKNNYHNRDNQKDMNEPTHGIR
jgi:hypothetical protein